MYIRKTYKFLNVLSLIKALWISKETKNLAMHPNQLRTFLKFVRLHLCILKGMSYETEPAVAQDGFVTEL
jgi:hypothetical protein